MKTLWTIPALLLLSGCGGPTLREARFSLPGHGEPAKVVVRLDEQPVPIRFDGVAVDYAEWVEHPTGDAPPHPLEALPDGARPTAAWVLRVRLRATGALVPTVYVAHREDAGLVYSTRRLAGRLEPGAGFDVTGDGSVLLSNPAAPPPVPGLLDPAEVK